MKRMGVVGCAVVLMAAAQCGDRSVQPMGSEEQAQALPFDPVGNTTSDFGMNTPGGRGGRVIRVVNLNATGEGSLRSAIEAVGARIVVFEVGGVIDLGKETLAVREPFLTVAGQTAPSALSQKRTCTLK